MESKLNYSLIENETEKESGKGKAIVEKNEITIIPKEKSSFSIPYEEISKISDTDYKINIRLVSGKKLNLSKLGHSFERFLEKFKNSWNKVALERLLMRESLKHSGPSANLVYENKNTEEKIETEAKIRLYETGLVLLMKEHIPKRIPYGDISKIEEQDYELSIRTGFGESIKLFKMGYEFDSFKDELFSVLNNLEAEMQDVIGDLAPGLSSLELRDAASLLKDGKAVERSALEEVSPDLWNNLVSSLGDFKNDLDFLLSLGDGNCVWTGLKKGLMGSLTESYVWFLVPIYSDDSEKVGNVLAMEACSLEEGKGMATYLFRMVDRDEYESLEDLNEMKPKVENFIRSVNRCMLDVNFRREPIYLSEEKLEEPQYSQYKFAINHIPSLELLRTRFLGRVIHSKRWGKNLLKLIKSKNLTEIEKVKK